MLKKQLDLCIMILIKQGCEKMKIYDISQEVFSCTVYPGDPAPYCKKENSIKDGDGYNLTSFSMCSHNGTHVDAPCHFIDSGYGVEKIPLESCIGPCFVCCRDGIISDSDAKEIIKLAGENSSRRILIKGDGILSEEGAEVFADSGILLIASESQSIGPLNAPAAVHKILLSENVVLLEGIRLNDVEEGHYFLSAQPLNLKGSDGSPCRAVLIDFENDKGEIFR